MANVTRDYPIRARWRPFSMEAVVASACIVYRGQFVFSTEGGTGIKNTPEPGDYLRGIVERRQILTAGEVVEFYSRGCFLLPLAGASIANMGDFVCIDGAAPTNNIEDVTTDRAMRAIAEDSTVPDGTIRVGRAESYETGGVWTWLDPAVSVGNVWY